MKNSATLLALLLTTGIALVYSGFFKNVNAQNKGSITGEVYVREDEEGKKSLLLAVGNECKDKKENCEKKPFDKVTLTFDGLDLADPLKMPQFPKFLDSDEYREFLESMERKNEKPQKWIPQPMPMPPIGGEEPLLDDDEENSLFFGSSWTGKAEKDGKKLKLSFGYRYDPGSFQPSNGLKAKVDLDDPKFEKALKKSVRVRVENNGKKVFDKKVKPQQLPKLDVQNGPVEELNLPNKVHPGESGVFSFDGLSDYFPEDKLVEFLKDKSIRMTFWIQKKVAKRLDETGRGLEAIKDDIAGNETVRNYNPFARKIIGVKRTKLTMAQLIKKKKCDNNQDKEDCEPRRPADSSNGNVDIYDLDIPPGANSPFYYYEIPQSNEAIEDDDRIGVTIFNDFGEKIADFVLPDVKLAEKPTDGGDTDEVGDTCFLGEYQAAQYVLQGRKLCVCGCFFNNEEGWDSIFTSFELDGKPIVPKAASSSTISFDIPEDAAPGLHKITYKTPGGKAKTVEFRVLAVAGTIDQDRLWTGQGTTMTLVVLGTDKPMPLLIENKTPAIIGISGGDRQIVNTSGGANNQVERQVLGMSRGNFIIDYSLDQPACPCFK